MANTFPNDDFDASGVETEPFEADVADATGSEAAAIDDTLGDGGSITDPLLVGASGPDGAGTGMGAAIDGPDGAADQERSAAADSPDATIPTAAGAEIPSGSRDKDGA